MKESQYTEWKETWRDEYLRWICGFANAEGGVLLIGRNDKGVAVGVSNARKHPSNPPNPLLANAFFRAGYIESWGRGIEKIRRECREHDIEPPVYDFEMSGLMLTFHANSAYLQASSSESRANERLGERLGEKLGETRAAIIRAMLANSKVTTTQLAKSLNISTTAVEKNIQFLKAQGLIARMGPAKGGYWKVREAAF
jgi:ATP-dependent DNA helicase RecG